MKIFVKAKTNAKEERIEKKENGYFFVYTKESPEKGKANKAIKKELAKYFKVPVSQIIIKAGLSSKHKIFEIIL